MSNVWNRCSTSLARRPRAKPARRSRASSRKARRSWKISRRATPSNAGLIAAGQAIEHYEISRYGTLRTWAQQLGMRDAERLLDQTLAEEKKTDQLLTRLAEASVNPKADKAA